MDHDGIKRDRANGLVPDRVDGRVILSGRKRQGINRCARGNADRESVCREALLLVTAESTVVGSEAADEWRAADS